MTTNCELKLQQDNTIMNKVRNLSCDLRHKPPGFVIQLRVQHTVQLQGNPWFGRTSCKPVKFLYVERDHFLTSFGMTECLHYILADEGIQVDAEGQFLNQSCLRLLWPSADRQQISFQSGPIDTLPRLAERVLDHARCMNHSHDNRLMKFLPLAMDLTVVRNHQLQFRLRVDESVILGDQSLQPNKSKKIEIVKLEEWRIEAPLTEKDCAICWDNLTCGQLVARTPCSHIFHKNCIATWLTKAHSCPLCRADLAKPA